MDHDVEPEAEEELDELHDRKQEEVLDREGLEESLMQQGRSEVGERITGVDDETSSPGET
jgi:hypothetical protein